jgi:hypothetical protein
MKFNILLTIIISGVFMYINLNDVLNPVRSGAIANRGIILNAYASRYNAIRSRILWACCTYETSYFVHLRIPSENPFSPDIMYDVVFEFYPTKKEDLDSGTLTNYGIKVYSNYITFMFSFTYVYNKYDLLIPWLKPKFSMRALFEPPVKSNPSNLIGTDIKMWFAAHHIKSIGLMDKRKFKIAINTTAQYIGKVVISQERMLMLRTQAAQAGKEAVQDYQKRKAKNINRKKDYESQKKIERAVTQNAIAKGENPGSAHTTARTLVKLARDPRMSRLAKSPRSAKKPKRAR